tara:strand:+ start:2384 stop:3127 length:744 start_codon:yes stop_codon:yes gene_type:complete
MANQNWVFNADSNKWESKEGEAVLKAPSRKKKEVKTIKRTVKRGKDAQQKMTGYCSCGRKAGRYRQAPAYCSRYCYLFENTVAPGYKKKTLYECWRGTGKYSYNPPYPKITVQCAWCGEDFQLGRNQSDENKTYCSSHCMRQATRSAVSTSARVGSKKIGDRVRLLRILRWFKDEPLTSAQIADYWNKWFRNTSCSYHKASNLCKMLEAKGLVKHYQQGTEKRTYVATDFTTPFKNIFGEDEILNNR